MYVCVCNAVTEDDVHDSLASGASSTKEVRAACGMKPDCGSCTKRLCATISRWRTASELADAITGGPLPFEIVATPPPRPAAPDAPAARVAGEPGSATAA